MIKQKKWKTKAIIINLILLFFYSIKWNNFLNLISIIGLSSIKEIKLYLDRFIVLKNIDSESSLFSKFKRKIKKLILKKNINKKVRNVKSLYIDVNFNFGNLIVFLNKILYYCEIIGCEYLILNKEKFWFINNTINNIFKNMEIKKGNHKFYKNSSVLYYKPWKIYSSFIYNIKSPIRIHFLRNQIINNLPKVKTNRDELYIHIRSGNVFKSYFHAKYSQPPYCFYSSILKKFKFKSIILTAKDSYNPVVKKLIKKFPTINYVKNDISKDISILINAFNIVCSISSFLIAILQLNYQFEFLWDFNIYKIDQKNLHYHFDFNKFPHNNFTIFRMEPSSLYKNRMYVWKHTRTQIKLMLKDKCVNEFTIIKKEN